MFRVGSLVLLAPVTALMASAQLTPAIGPVQYAFSLSEGAKISTATTDSTGAVYFGGVTSVALPATPGALQTVFAPCTGVPTTASFPGYPNCSWGFVGKLAPDGTLVWLTYLGDANGNSSVDKIAVDAKADVFVTLSFPFPPAFFPATPGTINPTLGGSIAVAELNPSGSGLVYVTYLQDVNSVNAIVPDSRGDLYLGITTQFYSSPALVNPLPGTDPQGSGYLVKLSAGGSSLLFATNLSAPGAHAAIGSLAVDSSDAVYVAGTCNGGTGSACVPTTAHAYQTQIGAAAAGAMFAMKVNAEGTLAFSTLLSGQSNGYGSVNQVLLDTTGNVILAGGLGGGAIGPALSFPVTPNAFQTSSVKHGFGSGSAFIAKLAPAGSALLYFTYFGGSEDDAINAAALDANGDIVFSGTSYSADLPVTADAWQPCHPPPNFYFYDGLMATFVGELSATGRDLVYASFVGQGRFPPNGAAGSSYMLGGLDPRGNALLFGTQGGVPTVVKYSLAGTPVGRIACVSNATHGYEGSLSLLGIVLIRGNEISGGRALTPQLTSAGTLPTSYNGLRVYVDGQIAPIFKMSPDEIAVITPVTYAKTGPVLVAVEQNGTTTGEIEAPVEPVAPAIVTTDVSGFGPAAVINQDGSINSEENPAPPGSVVTLYMTGLGAFGWPYYNAAGFVSSQAIPSPASLYVTIAGTQSDVLYAGSAPGLLLGVYQVNVRVPATIYDGLLGLGITADGQPSQSVSGDAEVGVYVSCSAGSTCRPLIGGAVPFYPMSVFHGKKKLQVF